MGLAIDKFKTARQNMIDCQIKPNMVTDESVIEAFAKVPREEFVPSYMRGIAYVDEDVDLGKGRFLMEPTTFARLLQAADIQESDIVLDIGCGTGYSMAILSELASTVIGIDEDADFTAQADQLLQDMDICNVALIHGKTREGYQNQAPFDVIFINGSVPHVPGYLTDQLAEGGRLITVLRGKSDPIGQAVLMTKNKGAVTTTTLFDASTHFVSGFDEQDYFTF